MARLTLRARIWWKDTKTGAEGVYEEAPSGHGSIWPDEQFPGEINWFMWDEGNYSCDCNREIFFLGARSEDVECGDGRFEIVKREAIPMSEEK